MSNESNQQFTPELHRRVTGLNLLREQLERLQEQAKCGGHFLTRQIGDYASVIDVACKMAGVPIPPIQTVRGSLIVRGRALLSTISSPVHTPEAGPWPKPRLPDLHEIQIPAEKIPAMSAAISEACHVWIREIDAETERIADKQASIRRRISLAEWAEKQKLSDRTARSWCNSKPPKLDFERRDGLYFVYADQEVPPSHRPRPKRGNAKKRAMCRCNGCDKTAEVMPGSACEQCRSGVYKSIADGAAIGGRTKKVR